IKMIEPTNLPYLRSGFKVIIAFRWQGANLRKSPGSVGPMREDIELTRVLGTIYNAALDPELWTDALAGVAAFVGGPIGAVGAEDQVSKLIDLDDIAALDLHGGPRHEVRGTCDSPATGPEKPEPGYMPLGVVGSEANETADHE